jgi:hypothetical protein
MQPILVDRGQFVPQAPVEIFNDLCIALHDPRPALGAPRHDRHGVIGITLIWDFRCSAASTKMRFGHTKMAAAGVNCRYDAV